jgi:hypothetical protein
LLYLGNPLEFAGQSVVCWEIQAICIYRCVQTPSTTRAKAAAKQAINFAVHLGAEDPRPRYGNPRRLPYLTAHYFPGCRMQRFHAHSALIFQTSVFQTKGKLWPPPERGAS